MERTGGRPTLLDQEIVVREPGGYPGCDPLLGFQVPFGHQIDGPFQTIIPGGQETLLQDSAGPQDGFEGQIKFFLQVQGRASSI